MIKKLLPALIGAALVGGMSNVAADVTAMGHLDTSVIYRSNGDSTTNLICTTCSFGFKGSEDLGNGLKAIFKIDFQFDMTERNRVRGGRTVPVTGVTTAAGVGVTGTATGVSTGSGSITDRDQWLGLGGGFGKVRIGTISTVYKSHGAMIDPVYRTSVQGRNLGIQSALHTGAGESGQGRATNTFRYDSPTFAGIQIGGHYTLQTDTGGDTDNPYGLGAQWKGGGLLVFGDYITSDAGGDDDAYKLGGRFGFGNFAVLAQYEFDGGLISTNQFGLGGDGADVWFVGGTGTFGNNTIYASYGQNDDSDGSGPAFSVASDQWEIVGVHSLSKRTKVYGGYASIDPDDSDQVDNWTLGMKHTF